MNKQSKLLAISIIAVGMMVAIFGVVKAPITDNSKDIRSKYACDRTIQDARATDIYCVNIKSAPGYKSSRHYTDATLISGSAITLLGIAYYLSKSNRLLK